MFYLYQHHDLTRLAEMLAVLRDAHPLASPLLADTVLVPNRGTARWLQAELTESEGTATNLHLPVPGLFVWRILRDTLPEHPDSSDYERERLVWHLHALLPGLDVPEVQRYLAAEPRERHRYQLARQLAGVFDQYLIHRRDVLAAWEAGREAPTPPASWQAPVWRAVVERIGLKHRARLLTDFLARAARGELDTTRLANPIHAFALVDLPADYLRLLYALGRFVDVHFLLPNPCATWWGDLQRRPVGGVLDTPTTTPVARMQAQPESGSDEVDAPGEAALEDHGEDPEEAPGEDPGFRFAASGLRAGEAASSAAPLDGHPLLASLGRAGRDFLRVLYSDEFAEMQEPLSEPLTYEPPGDDTLLRRVQSGVIVGEPAVSDAGMDATDASIQLHACHGPVREMQVLHDRLLDRMAADPDLSPRDILVLVPDIGRYAPAIHGVFGAATGARQIPYSVSDRPRLDTHPIAQTFQQLIELPLSRWTASEVLGLAGIPAVMRRFGIDAGDLALLQQWIASAGVRWGLDRSTRTAVGAATMGAAAFEQNTWRFGLDRLLLGLAQHDDTALVDGVAPWSDLEGNSAAAVGRLWLLVDRLRSWRDALTAPTTADVWQDRLNRMTVDLFRVDPDDAAETEALDTVFGATSALEEAAQALRADVLTWEAVREALLGALASSSQRQPLVTGSVTFSGLEPLRGVPFAMICLVGMDDGVFPRQDGQRGFNLLQKHPRSGDPSVRDGDRMTFLQALMAAGQTFYISYTGRDVADGSALQPSPVVGEFLDFLHGYCFAGWSRADARAALVTEQPMQPFSPRYFPGHLCGHHPHLFTFDGQWQRAARALCGERRNLEPLLDDTALDRPDPAEPIELGELQRFFRHPPRWFWRERMRLEFDEAQDPLEDEEPHGLDGLEQHRLRQRLFERAQAEGLDQVEAEPSTLERAQGALPPPPLGAAEHANAAETVNAILSLYWQWQTRAEDNEAVNIDLELDDGTRVRGRVADVGVQEMRRLRPGALRLTHLLPWWLDYLAVVASGHGIGLRVAGSSASATDQRTGKIDTAAARCYLQAAVDHYRRGHARPILFEPYIAEHYLDQRAKQSSKTKAPKTPDEALDSTNGWLSNRWQPPHPMRDPWLRPVFEPSPNPLGPDAEHSGFVPVVESVAAPIRAHLTAPENDA